MLSSKRPSSTISKRNPHTSRAPALLPGAGSLRHFCLHLRPDSECEAAPSAPSCQPAGHGGRSLWGIEVPFPVSPPTQSPPLSLASTWGGRLAVHIQDRGTRTAGTVKLHGHQVGFQARVQTPRRHFTRMRQYALRWGADPSPVCPRLPPARLPWGPGAAGPPRARHTDGAGSEQREGETTPRVLPTQLALDGDQQCSPMSSRGRYFHAPFWGSSARVHSQQARHHRQGEGHTFVGIKHRYM